MLMSVAVLLMATTSCELIYEGESDCSTKIKFEFRKHRQALQATGGRAADVFASTVGSVHLFIYDAESGELVSEQFVETDRLKTETELNIGTGSERCYLQLDLEPGTYRFVAWCGLDGNDRNNAFSLTGGTSRSGGYAECRVTLADGQPVHREKYEAVYHGAIDNISVRRDGSVIPIELTKDTNDIAVWIQHTTEVFAQGDYEVVYTDANGYMKFEDNTLTRDDRLEYHPHATSLLTSSTEYNGYPVEAGALVAHISTSRLMAAHKGDARLEVRNRKGDTVFSIPFIQYLLEMQTFTSDGQYYLDCEDSYNCSFYLAGDGGMWTPAMIIINNWVRVPDQSDSIGGEQ